MEEVEKEATAVMVDVGGANQFGGVPCTAVCHLKLAANFLFYPVAPPLPPPSMLIGPTSNFHVNQTSKCHERTERTE